NDSSPNSGIEGYLNELSMSNPGIVLLENETNMGFVATANRGMAYDIERDVLLLNSDVEVSGDWVSRLREAAYQQQYIASVTPFSNNATICSFPNFCEDNRLIAKRSLKEIDEVFSSLYSAEDVIQVPTGVGCCMYIRRDCLNETGYFDLQAFGRGYGEENDWCQRAQRGGWSNLHLANCFVYHKGGVSFGSEYKARVAHAQEVLDKKYPRYHADVQAFITKDPARVYRVKAWLSLFAEQNKPKVLMISHKLGGGAQQHVEELAHLYADQALFLQMTPDKDGETVRLSCFEGGRQLKDGLFFAVEKEYEKLVSFLRDLGVGRVHYHHTMGLSTRLWALAADLECGYDLTIHDYYLVNANPTQTDGEARYVGDKNPDFDRLCAEHYPLPTGISGNQWRANQRMLVEGADRIIFPSQDCRDRFSRFFTAKNAIVAWHADCEKTKLNREPEWTYQSKRPLRVLVLGALSREKGADVLQNVATLLANEPIEFHLLGYAYRALDNSVISHGPYDNLQVDDLVSDIAPDVVWFPAQWPETYSYTLSIALRNGLSVVVPDIGAFPERVQGRDLSVVVKWSKSADEWHAFWSDILQSGHFPQERGMDAGSGCHADHGFYASQYLKLVPSIQGGLSRQNLNALKKNLCANTPELSHSERALDSIWHFTRLPVVSKLVSIVPFRVQRWIKRLLSHRPMHDIVRK
ncbi:glycosyl transferase, partial [bacterium]|nr:glycosyl transferase [bacterium]